MAANKHKGQQMITLFITACEYGYELETDTGLHYGIAETLKEAKQTAQEMVEMKLINTWIINE